MPIQGTHATHLGDLKDVAFKASPRSFRLTEKLARRLRESCPGSKVRFRFRENRGEMVDIFLGPKAKVQPKSRPKWRETGCKWTFFEGETGELCLIVAIVEDDKLLLRTLDIGWSELTHDVLEHVVLDALHLWYRLYPSA